MRDRFVGHAVLGGVGGFVCGRWRGRFLNILLCLVVVAVGCFLGNFGCWSIRNTDDGNGRKVRCWCGRCRLGQREQLLLQKLGSDLVQRTGRHFGGGDAQLLGPDENEFALEVELLGDFVNANGHTGNQEWGGGQGAADGSENTVGLVTRLTAGEFTTCGLQDD